LKAKQERQKMDKQKQKWSLRDIANSVRNRLISQHNKNRFREQLQRFYEEYEAWDKDNDEYNRTLQVRNGEDEKAREKRIGKLKEPRPCPLELLDLSHTYKGRHLLDMVKLLCSQGPELSAEEPKILEACYVLLAIIHDKFFEHNPRITPISNAIWPQDEMWVETTWKKIKDNAYQPALQDDINYILELVETDLPNKPAETEQIPPLRKLRRIRAWFKTPLRIISAIIAFLATLLTCVYLFWWLCTKIFSD